MIIKISQTASNIKQSYDIESENFYYSGDAEASVACNL